MNRKFIRRLRKFGVTYAIAALLLAGHASAYALEPTSVEPTEQQSAAVEPTEIKAK